MLQDHPIFSGATELLSMCEKKSYNKHDIIFQKNQARPGLMLITAGVAEVYISSDDRRVEEVLEVVQPGELFGFSSLASFLGASPYDGPEQLVEVRAIEQVDALLIPFDVLTKRWDDPNVHDYLLQQISVRLRDIYTSLAEQVKLARHYGESKAIVTRVQDIMTDTTIQAEATTTIRSIAALMAKHRVSSILISQQGQLQGIITERDLVNRVLAAGYSYDEPAVHIMTVNPITISRFAYFYDALSTFLQHNIKHLPVVENDRLVGIVSLSDLLRKKNENMIRTLQQVDNANHELLPRMKSAMYDVLANLMHDKVPVAQVLTIMTDLYDRLVKRCVQLAVEELGSPPSAFSFYVMGSSGRREQFLLTDQDHFLVYEQDHPYFSKLGEKIVKNMERAGYARCKGDMMASNPQWRGTIQQWRDRLRQWSIQSTNENLLLAQNFFSYRKLYGDEEVHETFEDGIRELLDRSKIFLYRLAQLEKEHPVPTLDQPIRSLFRLDRKSIDMKKEILFPYHHSLQILSLVHRIISGTPQERIQQLANKGVLEADFIKDITTAIDEVMTVYVTRKWQQHTRQEQSSSILMFTHMTSREKEELILSLKSIRELQGLLYSNFSL
ncbi:CBS domain-containing protein [Bacillus sp. HMF5848]|uniref:DUF294 nucleotidyltransferase-like domain-containing protein n=1 Tax=Bacillus sp. HMF5848 TaxID=2495421 RepID=UPI000F79FA25|nr:DUF294 nucleotidyltransferase-like domain-containing protein [Bacillus sp. HMF5848]RSK28910.1 CBS domain-containing protein [Bacillus sp. HMF5848]